MPLTIEEPTMLLLNANSINSLLLFILLFGMLWYLIARSEKNREAVFLIIFIIQLVLWQFCFLIRNMFFDPAADLPLFYFLHSGYTVFSYTALAMFSYYFVTPVFKKESQIVFFVGMAVSVAFFLYSVAVVFPGGVQTYLNPVLHVYEAEPAPHRKYILYSLLILILLTAKNMVYKIAVLRGEQRAFVLHISVAMLTGVFAVVGVSFLHQFYPIPPNIHNTINTYLSGMLFIYFYLVYLSYSKIQFLYFDKTILLILFTVIIIVSLTMSLSYLFYERDYIRTKQGMADRIALDIDAYENNEERVSRRIGHLYSDEFGYIVKRDEAGNLERVYHDRAGVFGKAAVEPYIKTGSPVFQTIDGAYFYCFQTTGINGDLHAGVPYLEYRKHIHNFAMACFYMVLVIIGALFIFMRLVIFIGLTRPLKQLLSGIREIRGGNLNHKINLSAQDEIGFIAAQFNLMVDDLRISDDIIRKSEQKFRELTGMLPDIVYETNLNLDITYLNQAGFDITGFDTDDLKKGLSLHDWVDENEFGRLQSMLAGKWENLFQAIITHRIKRKNGDILHGENNAAIIYENNRPVGLRGVIRDVTEKIRIENSLIQAQKMETIGTLAGGIAHDFNNILTGITGTVSLLEFKAEKSGDAIAEEIKKDLNTLRKSADRAADMVSQLLALSRHRKPALERTDINGVAKNVYEICKNSFDKKIRLNFQYQEGGAFALTDETQMGQVLLNLCINARDAMTFMRPEGDSQSGELSVLVERFEPKHLPHSRIPEMPERPYIRLRVRDTGVGMDSRTRSRIFDPFYTTKPKDKGTGLGLTMVYNIMKQHDGFIDIQSRVSQGTTIDLYIPADDSPFHQIPAKLKDVAPETTCGTLLLVDDDPIIQKTCGAMLSTLGCQVITARNGREGVNVYRAQKDAIDGVLLDVEMPVMSGNEAFEEIRAINPKARVLVSSGYRDDPRIDKMIENGALGFIQKPYTLKTLSKKIALIIQEE